MAALADLAVVVVEVQARRAQVEFVGLVQIADTRGEDGVDAGNSDRLEVTVFRDYLRQLGVKEGDRVRLKPQRVRVFAAAESSTVLVPEYSI